MTLNTVTCKNIKTFRIVIRVYIHIHTDRFTICCAIIHLSYLLANRIKQTMTDYPQFGTALVHYKNWRIHVHIHNKQKNIKHDFIRLSPCRVVNNSGVYVAVVVVVAAAAAAASLNYIPIIRRSPKIICGSGK